MALDPRIILGMRALPTIAEQTDFQQKRANDQQELDIRGQELDIRRKELEQKNKPQAASATDQLNQIKLNLERARVLTGLLEQTTPENYSVFRGMAQHLVGDDAKDLPDVYPGDDWKAQHIAAGKAAQGQIQQAAEQFTLAPGSKRFDASGKMIAEVPVAEKAAAASDGFTLAPGGRRYDAEGNLVASAPERPAGAGAAERLVPIMGPDGKPVLVRASQAEGKTPASSREQGRPVTSGDANRLADLDTSLNDLSTLKGTIPKGATGTAAQIGAALPNFVTNATGWGVTAKEKQAVIDRVKQVIGKALEGGVLRKEDEYKYSKILPTIGDSPEVVATKLQGLQQAISQRKQTTLDALDDAGYDTGRFRSRDAAPTAAPAAGKTIKVGPYTGRVKP